MLDAFTTWAMAIGGVFAAVAGIFVVAGITFMLLAVFVTTFALVALAIGAVVAALMAIPLAAIWGVGVTIGLMTGVTLSVGGSFLFGTILVSLVVTFCIYLQQIAKNASESKKDGEKKGSDGQHKPF